jgi:phosphoenolpyruvate-protein kinase (PTS system EI component)
MPSGMESLDWYEDVACLLSKCVIAPLVRVQDLGSLSTASSSACAIYARSLKPEQLVSFFTKYCVQALIVQQGSLADHTAVLTNASGVQLAIAPGVGEPPHGTFVLIDGVSERLALGTCWDQMNRIYTSLGCHIDTRRISESGADYPVAVYVDGNKPEELAYGLAQGASGVGILRSDWLGWLNETPPSHQKLLALYRQASLAVQPYRLNVRLFDLGGDKIPRWCKPYSHMLRSPLGFRGIRAVQHLAEAFDSQFKAIVECADTSPLGVVIPMVTDMQDVRFARAQLKEFGTPRQLHNIVIGAMVEVPAAALFIEELVREVDFVRIGPGDLSQFTLAKLRTNIPPRDYSGKGFHPAVLQLIRHVSVACRHTGKELSVCLDIEPRTALLESLLRIGVRVFATSPTAISAVLRCLHEGGRFCIDRETMNL